ncbi:putative molybdenum carrier protein [Prosthecobacter fusiformis]|uniref:Putative molybdenum carrier protein n=1 Tax=Prosthecobacter fusiformis TaxID=48464 RepID=A0A4R7RIS2_9BACT|nr:putative molybdenum carrier protein [Prosthecobacter fusiformis]TDU63089.1 putative molybdenum carrier protein [Prosthecobacter fusiformis]
MRINTTLTIISGGQTGVDQGALDAALDLGSPCGGWCPAGRVDEDGIIPARFPLRELTLGGYKARTIRNLCTADGTLIIYFGDLEGGTELTASHCIKIRKPYRLINGCEISPERAAVVAREFVQRRRLRSLNIAGPRASRRPEGYAYAYSLVKGLLNPPPALNESVSGRLPAKALLAHQDEYPSDEGKHWDQNTGRTQAQSEGASDTNDDEVNG